MDLIEFLRARLDEDERGPGSTHYLREVYGLPCPACGRRAEGYGSAIDGGVIRITHGDTILDGCDLTDDQYRAFLQGDLTPEAQRVLREVEAKRRIVETCEYFLHEDDRGIDPVADSTLRDLASIYADHPDYDPAWAPAVTA